jgi:hypothetical protein
MDRWGKDNNGAHIHPHPLAIFISDIVNQISSAFGAGVKSSDESLLCAVAAALESMLTSADLSTLNNNGVGLLVNMFSWIADSILTGAGTAEVSAPDFSDDLKKSCARTIGVFIAISLQQNDTSDDLTQSGNELSALADKLFTRAVDSASLQTDSHACRNDWIILATACSNGTEQVAHRVVDALLVKAIAVLRSSQSVCPPLMAFSFITLNGGPHVAKAFHSMVAPNMTYLDIIDELCKNTGSDSAPKGQLNVGVSQLKLPATITKEEETYHSMVCT